MNNSAREINVAYEMQGKKSNVSVYHVYQCIRFHFACEVVKKWM